MIGKDICPALPALTSRQLVPVNSVSAFGKSVYGTLHQVSPRKSSMMKSCRSCCHWCGSAQMVQQQLKLVATLSCQLWVHLASLPKHQRQGNPPTVQTQSLKDEIQHFSAIRQKMFFLISRLGVGV